MIESLHIVNCNISYNANIKKIYAMLERYMVDNYIITLQEVTESKYVELKYLLQKEDASLVYSLEYRKPGNHDGKSRKLGVLIIAGKTMQLLDCGVFERALFPDRTAWAIYKVGEEKLKVASFHSITGCDHRKAKSISFLSMAEAVDDFLPDIVTIDANEPAVDHYEVSNMIFCDKNGPGARTFFNVLTKNGLKDSYAIDYDPKKFVEGEPLTCSHVIKGNKKKLRYDFAFINTEKIVFDECEYNYEQAVAASADHAIIKINCKDIDGQNVNICEEFAEERLAKSSNGLETSHSSYRQKRYPKLREMISLGIISESDMLVCSGKEAVVLPSGAVLYEGEELSLSSWVSISENKNVSAPYLKAYHKKTGKSLADLRREYFAKH